MPRSHQFASASAVEEAFYAALAHADVAGVMALWADDDDVVCVHPGGERLVGLHAVRQSYEEILAGGPLHVRITDLRTIEGATIAVHNLVEQITIATPAGTRRVSVLTTNVYVKGASGWQMLLHHATPGQELETAPVEVPAGRLH